MPTKERNAVDDLEKLRDLCDRLLEGLDIGDDASDKERRACAFLILAGSHVIALELIELTGPYLVAMTSPMWRR